MTYLLLILILNPIYSLLVYFILVIINLEKIKKLFLLFFFPFMFNIIYIILIIRLQYALKNICRITNNRIIIKSMEMSMISSQRILDTYVIRMYFEDINL